MVTNSERATKVYKYGLLAPTAHADAVREQMHLAHRYRNALVEIARERRAEQRAIDAAESALQPLAAKVAEADARLSEALAAIATLRKATRSRSETKAHREAVTSARLAKKAATKAWREKRTELRSDPERIAVSKAAWARSADRTKAARAANGLHWGTGALVDDAMEAAAKMPLYDGTEPSDPKFARWEGEGQVGVQVHQSRSSRRPAATKDVNASRAAGITSEDVLGCTVVGEWLGIANAASWVERPARSPGVARGRALNAARHAAAIEAGGGSTVEHRELRMRIGTTGDGSPIVACWPMAMHRPLPAGAIVKRAAVSLRRIGPREVWSGEVTVSMPAEVTGRAPPGSGAVAIDIGWLAVPGGMRVATWLDQSGRSGRLVLSDTDPTRPPERRQNRASGGGVLASFAKADSIQAIRDRHFNEAQAALVEGLRANGCPAWIRAATVRRWTRAPSEKQALAHLAAWKAPGRLAALALRWRENRWDGDEAALAALEAWRYNDHHLWAWTESQQKSAVRRRRDIYRVFAAGLAARYETLIVGDVNYALLARRAAAEEDVTIATAAANRQNAAPGDLRATLVAAFVARGGAVDKQLAAGLSVTCPACGGIGFQNGNETECAGCGHKSDRDTVMAMGLMRAAGHGADVDAMIDRGKRFGQSMRGGPSEQAAE